MLKVPTIRETMEDDKSYPYNFIDSLAYISSPENITNREVIRANNEIGLAICIRLDRLLEKQ